MYAERVLPHDIEAEEAVIGALLIDGEAIHEIASILRPEDFYRERNRWCYEAAIA
ncbi:MAG: replicative DNA helicase, partial [SAR202 cluster bacterium]|nr:replicative DNA helicase [SAR202 cluster bacterium]